MGVSKYYPEIGRLTEITSDHVPDVRLCRFFSQKKYADDFNCGRYRFVNLKEYRQSEFGVRSDPTELEFTNNLLDGSTHFGSSSSSCFAICFTELDSCTDISLLKKKFGNDGDAAVALNIESNLNLTRSIQSAWVKSLGGNGIAFFRWYKVVYNKFDCVEHLDSDCNLHVYQKPKNHVMHRFKRVLKKPTPKVCIDTGGDIGNIRKFSSLDSLGPVLYRDFSMSDEWVELDPEINSFEVEREWRLVFFSDFRRDEKSGEYFPPMEDNDYFLNL